MLRKVGGDEEFEIGESGISNAGLSNFKISPLAAPTMRDFFQKRIFLLESGLCFQ